MQDDLELTEAQIERLFVRFFARVPEHLWARILRMTSIELLKID